MSAFYQSVKIKVSAVLIFMSTLVPAQNFSPFNASVTKRFYNSDTPTDNSYFFYADSIHGPAPGITIFHQYFTLQSSPYSANISGCAFWGGGGYTKLDTTWLGVDIGYDAATKHLLLRNFGNDTLEFNFSILPGDSAIFFQNNVSKYYIKAGQIQTETVYSVTDTVKPFTVLHYGVNNQIVNSPLHGKQIKLAQNTGLIGFIDAFNFPASEKYLVLQGQLNPLIGTYQIRFEDLYPFQVGDSMQYNGYEYPAFLCGGYIRGYRVISRTETTNDVQIKFAKSLHHIYNTPPLSGCQIFDVYPDVLTFPKNSDLIGYPYNRQDEKSYPLTRSGEGYETRTESSSLTICGNRSSYTGTADPLIYCRTCACIGAVDEYGFSNGLPSRTYAKGVGVIETSQKRWGSQWLSSGGQWQNTLSLTYASIGGQACGSYYYVGLPEYELNHFSVHPNPTKDELTISAPIDELNIFLADGTAVQNISQPSQTIDISHLSPGLYILQLRMGKKVEYSRMVKL
jgi:hypothetical protein